MSEPQKPVGTPSGAAKPVPPPEGNPAFRMMGLPRLRAKLPSRNWTIFFTVVGSFSAAVIYDRRQKKKAQQKWCNSVSHLSEDLMPTNRLPKRYTIYLAAPPGDGLRTAREHFQEYVKPMLVAAAVDWDVVEGRNEGDLRANVANRVRQHRRKEGEPSEATSEEDVLEELRRSTNIQDEGPAGEIVIGRHTWKEYIRGLHEGWLGPMNPPPEPQTQISTSDQPLITPLSSTSGSSAESTGHEPLQSVVDKLPTSEGDRAQQQPSEEPLGFTEGTGSKNAPETKETTTASRKASPVVPYILPDAYETASLAPSAPSNFSTTIVLPQPHLLGFLNTPIRIYRFLNRRHLANETGELVSSLLLSTPEQLYESPLDGHNSSIISYDGQEDRVSWEQQRLLLHEENDWHKIARKPNPPEDLGRERPWTEAMVMDARIGSRMRKSQPSSIAPIYVDSKEVNDMSTSQVDDGSEIRGNATEWKGGADRPERLSWTQWFLNNIGFVQEEEQCKGWEHGELGDDS